jgi:hypothetical protein
VRIAGARSRHTADALPMGASAAGYLVVIQDPLERNARSSSVTPRRLEMKGCLARREDLEGHRDPRPAVRKGLGPAQVNEASAKATGNGGLAVRARRMLPTTTVGATAPTPQHGSSAQVHPTQGCPVRGKTLGRLATGAASSARGLTGPRPSDAAHPDSAQGGVSGAHPAASSSAQMGRSAFPLPARWRPLRCRSRPPQTGGASLDPSVRAPLCFGRLEPWYLVDGPTCRCS